MIVVNLFSGVIFWQEEGQDPTCLVCGARLAATLKWSIVHGEAYCECGAGYYCLAKDEKGEHKPPICLVDPTLLPKYQEAWKASEGDYDVFEEKAKAITEAANSKGGED